MLWLMSASVLLPFVWRGFCFILCFGVFTWVLWLFGIKAVFEVILILNTWADNFSDKRQLQNNISS